MNSFTNLSEFTESAESILDNCELLIKSNCFIVNDVLYERLAENLTEVPNENPKYRFFFNSDDYDYLVDNESLINHLDELFQSK